MKFPKAALWFAAGIVLTAALGAIAAQTNFLGVVFIADPTTPSQQLTINSDGSINTKAASGGTAQTVNQGTQASSSTGSSWFFQGIGTAGTPAGGVQSVQGVSGGTPAPVTIIQTGSTVIGADVVTLSGGAAITMFATNHCANGCRVSVPVAFCTNPLTTATSTATTGGNECWQANQSVAMPPTGHAISVFSTTASTASGIGSTVP